MKLTAILLLLACLQVSANGFSQNITLSERNTTLQKVFKQIHKQTGYQFFYEDEMLDKAGRINIKVKAAPLEKVLDICFENLPLSYSIVNNTITVKRKTEDEIVQIPPPAFTDIHGTVKDAQSNPLAGVSIIVKGTSRGTSTNSDGSFSIEANAGDVLEFTIVGYQKKSMTVGQGTNLNVVMEIEASIANEVVVVGYGTQKKINLSGAVNVVTSKDIENRPVNNAVDALQGLAPNLNLSVGNEGGEPGAKHNLNIRGIGSINGSGGTPYILIDGIEGDLYRVNPSDIESISVLKDASASAIYGARAAFGVILVTTKKGSTAGSSINYSNNLSFSNPVTLPKTVNSLKWAEYFNLASINDGNSPIFSDETIEKMKKYQAGELKDWTEPYEVAPTFWKSYQDSWANTDWYKEEYRRWAPKSNHSISISGGNKKTQYYISGATFNQKGLIKWGDDKYVRDNLNAKINTQINTWLRTNFQTRYNKSELSGPSYNTDLWYHNIFRRWPTNGLYAPDGTLFYEMEQVWLTEGGRSKIENSELYITPGLEIEPVKGFVLYANYRYRKSSGNSVVHNSKVKVNLATGDEVLLGRRNHTVS